MNKINRTWYELRFVILISIHRASLKEFHDTSLSGQQGIRITYSRICDSRYFRKLREVVLEYVSNYSTCQRFNYRYASPGGKRISIKITYIIHKKGLYKTGPYPFSTPKRYSYVLVNVDYFSKWVEFIPLRKAFERAITNGFFYNFVFKYGAPVELVSNHSPSFVSDIFCIW